MTRNTALTVASVLAVLHLVLACVYASITPYRSPGMLLGQRDPGTGALAQAPDVGAPDERQHANYTIKLLNGEGFPVLDPKDPNLIENYQAHQPPLYYILHAGWCKITGANLESADSGLKVRSLNALIGAATVIGVFFLGLWAFKREDVGVVAAAFVALLPMNTALSGAVSNDPLLYCLCTWTLAFLAKGCVGGWTLKTALLVGLFTGLGLLTKTTAIALLPVLLLALFLGPNRPSSKQIAVCAGVFVIIATPWLVRNQNHYGDPLALSAFNEAFKGSPAPVEVALSGLVERDSAVAEKLNAYAASHPDLKGRELLRGAEAEGGIGANRSLHYWSDWVGWWTARSFFGVFGYMDIFLNESSTHATGEKNPNALYRMFLALGALVVMLWVLALRREEWKEHKRMHWLLGVFLLVIVVLFMRFNAQYFQGQARYLFPAIGVIGIGVAIAVLGVARSNWRAALAVIVVLLGGLNLYALMRLPEEFKRRTLSASLPVQTDHGFSNVLSSNGRGTPRV